MVPRALIAEDDADLVVLMGSFLCQHGFEVVSALDGVEARQRLSTHAIDVAVLDVELPKSSGLELLSFVRKERPDTPVFVISGAPEHQQTALELGAEAFLTKPVSPKELLARLERSLRYARALAGERRARAVAERALQLHRDFLSMATHDLRNPLNSLRLTHEVMRRDVEGIVDSERRTRMLRRIDSAGQTAAMMQTLIDGLLDQAALEQGGLHLNRTAVDASRILTDFVEVHRPIAEARGIDLRVETTPQSLLVHCDPDRALRVLANLGTNALKHVPPGGSIRVKAEPAEGRAKFTVADTGPGIPPDQIESIFDRFFQLKPSPSGVGLGLYIARGLVEAHGGKIWCEPPGSERGAKFVFTLPLADPAATG